MIAIDAGGGKIAGPPDLFRGGDFRAMGAQHRVARRVGRDRGEQVAGLRQGRAEVGAGPDQRLDAFGGKAVGLFRRARGADDAPALRQQDPREGLRREAVAEGEERVHGAFVLRAARGCKGVRRARTSFRWKDVSAERRVHMDRVGGGRGRRRLGEDAHQRDAPSLGRALQPPWSALYLKSTKRRLNGDRHRQCALPGGGRARPGGLRPWFRAKGGAVEMAEGPGAGAPCG